MGSIENVEAMRPHTEYQSMKDKVIAVTGGASGIAFSLCQKLVARGAIVCIADISAASIQTAGKHFKSQGADFMITQVDVSNRQQVDDWTESIISKYGRLDGAANCAAIVGKHHGIRAVTELDDDEWDRIMNINLKGLMFCLRAQLRVVPDGASIVNVSSILGVTGYALHGAYVASKHAVIGLTRTAAKENGLRGIRVNAVAPGAIRTPLLDYADTVQGDKHDEPCAMQRLGKPEEVSSVIAFLLGPESTFVTGMTYGVDGGWAC